MITPSIHHQKNQEIELVGLAEILHAEQLLEKNVIHNAYQQAKKQGIAFITYLVKSKLLSSETLLNCCVKHFNLPVFDLKNYDLLWLNHATVNAELVCRYHILPLKTDEHSMQLGVSDPSDNAGLSAIRFHTNLTIHPVLIAEIELEAFINTYYRPNILYDQLASTLTKLSSLEGPTLPPILFDSQKDEDEPVIKFVDQLLRDGIEKQISDIHIEPNSKNCRIRFRRDGLLYEAASLPLQLANRLIMRLKIMANLNIAERRIPQDGHIKNNSQYKIDIRINSCPTVHGEKIVLRLMDTSKINLDITTLGFLHEQQELFINKISQPQGLILITGPTGSGKTISLYSALHHLNQIEKNIVTVEDPVEIELLGINQVSINPSIGFDFSHALRTLLRQDPDILMIGEIRDPETANIAIQAAQTGHLVMATLHTNSTLETIHRLQSIGVDSFHLTNCISLIISQRLLRKKCCYCNQIQHPQTCQHCFQGYHGRIGIFECLEMNDETIDALRNEQSTLEMIKKLRLNGWQTLQDIGLKKVEEGITTHEEVVRVLGFE